MVILRPSKAATVDPTAVCGGPEEGGAVRTSILRRVRDRLPDLRLRPAQRRRCGRVPAPGGLGVLRLRPGFDDPDEFSRTGPWLASTATPDGKPYGVEHL